MMLDLLSSFTKFFRGLQPMLFIQSIPVPKYITDLGTNCRYFYLLLAGLMLLYVLRRVFILILEVFLLRGRDLHKLYGKSAWVLITGATDGIGWEFCKLLAKKGHKLLLVGRSDEKLQGRIQELISQTKNQRSKGKSSISTPTKSASENNIQTDRFVGVNADFSKGYGQDFYDNFYQKIQGYNISVLINNVGVLNSGSDLEKEAFMMINVNTLPQTMLTKMLLPHFEKRYNDENRRSAVINTSSILGKFPMPGFTTLYCATKAFTDFFSRGFGLRYAESIDTLCVTPWYTSTNMNDHHKIDWKTATPKECAEGSLRALGWVESTYGATKHVIVGFFVDALLSQGFEKAVQKWMALCRD